MHNRKSLRHQRAAQARWRATPTAGDAVDEPRDLRQPITLDLRSAGGPLVTLEPRIGYIGWRVRDEAGEVSECAALKTLLHRMADRLPRTAGAQR